MVSRAKLANFINGDHKDDGSDHDILGNLHLDHKWIDDSVDGVVDTHRKMTDFHKCDIDEITLSIAT